MIDECREGNKENLSFVDLVDGGALNGVPFEEIILIFSFGYFESGCEILMGLP